MAAQPEALVYRGPASCEGCPEAVAQLLRSSPSKFLVDYVGPNENIKLTQETLSTVDVYAQPGGGGLDESWPDMKSFKPIIRDFVSNGGRYMGFCLGAYLAGYTPGFGLLPQGADTDSKISQCCAQVANEDDTVIQVDWTFASGSERKGTWLYFQDGAVLDIPEQTKEVKVIARYSTTGDIAASLSSFGKG